MIIVDGLSLVATWSEPFSVEGEEFFYVIFITGSGNLKQNFSFNETVYEYVFSEPIEEMDCTQYIMFTVFSENEYSRSIANVSEWKNVPTGIYYLYQYTKYLYYIQRKIFFRRSFFLYSPCPNLEGIKDAIFYKFRRPTIGQNCSAVCTNKGGHRDAFSNERREAPRVSRACSAGTEPQAKQETKSVLCHSLVVLEIRQSEDVAIAVASSSSCY